MDLTLGHVRRRDEQKRRKREEQGTAIRRPKGPRDNRNVDYMGRAAGKQQLHPSDGEV